MSTTRHPEPRAPRILRVRGHRLFAAVLSVVVVPTTLAACGMLGSGTNHGQDPVVIPSASAADAADNAASGSPTDSPSGSAITATQSTTQVVISGGMTVTRTGYVVRTQVNTKTQTQIKTQQVIKTAAPVTNTQTQTVTSTVTQVVTSTVQGPATTITVKCTVGQVGC